MDFNKMSFGRVPTIGICCSSKWVILFSCMVLNKTFHSVSFGEKIVNKNLYLRRSLIFALLVLVVFSAMGTSMAYARETVAVQAPADNTAATSEENPTLIATQDNSTTATEGTPVLTRTQDDGTTPTDENSTLFNAKTLKRRLIHH